MLYDLAWPLVNCCGLVCPFYGLLWFFYHLWQDMDLIGLIISFLAAVDTNLFGLILIIWLLMNSNKFAFSRIK